MTAANKIPRVAREHTGSDVIDRIQRVIANIASALGNLPFLYGNLVKQVPISNAGSVIGHGLGRAWRGYKVTRVTGGVAVGESASQAGLDPTRQISMTASASTTADIWFF